MRRSSGFAFGPLLWALCLLLPLASRRTLADDALPPSELATSQVTAVRADKDVLEGAFPGLLLTVRAHEPIFDTRYHQPYRATCCVYVKGRSPGSSDYSRRFLVHVPDAEALPTAKRVARMLVLLQGEVQARLRSDHPGRYRTVSVWLTRRVERELSPDTAGEQFKDQIYVYNLFADRRAIEWGREIAHEYGHFALVPGAFGFTAPEEDSNGVLGERLFLKWLWSDLHAGRLQAQELPFLTPDQIDTYIGLQVTPLQRRIAQDGPDARLLARRDGDGMDYYTGLMLYFDTLYGSGRLQDIRACTVPQQGENFAHAPDFLRGAVKSLTENTSAALRPADLSINGKSASIFLYLPRGEYTLRPEGSIASWQPFDPALRASGSNQLTVTQSGWRRLTVTFSRAPEAATALRIDKTSK